MNFRSYEIKDICKIKSGKRLPKGTDFSEKPTKHKYIRARDIKNGKIDGSDLGYISEETQKKIERYIVNTNDIIITIAGTIGEVALVSKKFDGVNLTENAVRLTEFSKDVCPEFLAYILKSPERKEYMEQVAGGSAQPKLGIYKIEAIKVDLPDVQIQHKIADILSAYDNLIENNQRQIKLLEEAAQRLYKEWFVDLRFPGRENTKIVDGVPKGWSRTNINEILTFHRGYDLTKNEMKAGRYPVVGSTTVIGYHNEFKIKGPGIVTGRSGSLGKYQFIWDDFWPHNTSLYISDYKDHNIFFVYSLLQTVDFTSLNNGGAIPTLNRNVLSNIEVIEPEKKLQDMFAKIAEPQYQKIKNLEKQNDRLKTARGLLLPKLMSGEVEV